jgi:RNA polymerase sigma-70 factor (ECF subfamily)
LDSPEILPKCSSGANNEAEASLLLASLYRSWYIPVVRYARHKIRDYSMAEDMVHDAFMALYSDLRSGKTIEKPKAWLFVAVRRRIVDHYRHSARLEAREDHGQNLEEVAAPEAPAGVDSSGVSGLFGILSDRELEVLLLRINSMKYREIGSELGISANSVSQLLARAIRKLRNAMTESTGRGYARREQ